MEDKVFNKKPFLLYCLLILSVAAYYFLAYQTARENFFQVFGLFTFLFVVFFISYKLFSATHFKYLIIAGIVFRILLLFSIPNLSEDVYRFIWDGRLAANGINPFSHLPADIMQMPAITGISKELYLQLNSVDHYTIYPPVLQGIFWSGAKLFPENVYAAIVFFKCIILLFEVGTLFVMLQILKKLSLPKHLSLLYILNPLVITELTGNAHFDGVMIFFVLLSFLLILKNKWQASAIFLGLGIAAKLLPILFLPLIIKKKLGWKKGLLYSIVTGGTTIVLFALVFDIATIQHMLNSIDLFIRKFEFNASVYYVIRYIGTLIKGYNIIAVAGPFLILLSSLITILISSKEKKFTEISIFNKALFIISIWFFF
ncbi:MAG TPA: glycosyltransferase 87 family protein, partial [Chitinophagaceae bacterium]|nr:glycosyltransferase 87 family protein [Chitinophagaceae bacterium]